MSKNFEIPVLMYHRIIERKEEEGIYQTYVYKKELIKQFDLLKEKNIKLITFADIENGILEKDGKYAILTFDDGYLDNYTILFPLLKKYNFKAVIYPVTDLDYNIWDNEEHFPFEKKLQLMSWDQMREMLKSGLVEFGGHTRNHCDLLVVDREIAFNEIKECKEILEKELNREVLSFSYPFGRFNDSHKIMLRDIRYKYGVAIESGPANFGEEPYSIRRIEIYDRVNIRQYKRMIGGNYNRRKIRVEKLKKIVKKVIGWDK